MEWNELEKLLDGDTEPEELVNALTRMDDRDRRALSKPLAAHAKQWWLSIADVSFGYDHSGVPGHERRRRRRIRAGTEALRLAVAGTFGDSRAAATWLVREAQHPVSPWPRYPRGRELDDGRQQSDRLNRVLAVRSRDWTTRVFTSVASRLRTAMPSLWRDIVIGKIGDLGIVPPATPEFTHCWIGRYIDYGEETYAERLAALRADPLLPSMLDALFTVDGLGHHFEILLWTDHDRRALPTYLTSLLEHGDTDRGFLIDGCLRRLSRGGRVGDLRPYRLLLEDVAPTPAESAERRRDLLALLPDAVSSTAGAAQRALRATDEAGLLDGESIVEASGAILFRTEKKLVRDQLSWIDTAIKRHPDSAADLTAALGTAFGHESPDVQARAVTVLLRHRDALTPDGRDELAAAAATLASVDRNRLAGVLDVAEPDPEPVVSLTPPVRRADPEPITSVPELAERVAGLRAMVETDPRGEALDPAGIEPVLAALVSFAHRDRPGLTAALRPVLSQQWRLDPEWYRGNWALLLDGVMFAAARAAGTADAMTIDADIVYRREKAGTEPNGGRQRAVSRWRKGMARLTGPERVLAHRLVELALRITDDPVPHLLATDIDGNGFVDAHRLVERLRRAETDGWQPWEFDLQQALLRLPRTVPPEAVAAAETLTSPAGTRLVDWLAGRSRPDITVIDRPMVMHDGHGDANETTLPLAKVAVRQPDSIRGDGVVQLSDLLRLSFPQRVAEYDLVVETPDWPKTWAAVLPSRPDVIAAELARLLGPMAYWERDFSMPDRYFLSVLPDLAELDGPAEPTLSGCLALGLNVSGVTERTCVVDALTTLAARGRLDATAVAGAAAELVLAGIGKCTRIATALRETADAGAARQVWDVLAAMLPPLLSTETTPNRLSDLMELAARIADTVDARGRIPAVAEAAARRGSSKLVKEAKRLHQALTR